MERFAVISVSDKTGLIPFAKGLQQHGLTILSTGGTARYLQENGCDVRAVSDYTGHPEILDGRVKTLHPKIHGGVLARRSNPADMNQLDEQEIGLIDFVIVNLYPFVDKVREVVSQANPNHESLVESIDIGGPTMLRAAAKNCYDVVPVCDPKDYEQLLAELSESGAVSLEMRRRLASKVFAMMSAYDGEIARYFSLDEKLVDTEGKPQTLAPVESIVLTRDMSLRYGENPHQSGALYRHHTAGSDHNEKVWRQLQGKELSYNNLSDMQGALELFLDLRNRFSSQDVSVIIKHANPCGAAVASAPEEAFVRARDCDPISAFGGIVAVSGKFDELLASRILEGFVEVVIGEDFDENARAVFAKKKNVRVIECDFDRLYEIYSSERLLVRDFAGDYLLQSADTQLASANSADVATKKTPSQEMLADLEFAWVLCKHVKSNAIVVASNLQAIGVGAGQMSRVDAAKIALQRAAQHEKDVRGAVAASDAFLPFPDTLEVLNDAGVGALVQPGGSIKDAAVVEAADARDMVMVLTGERHFRH